MTNPWHHLATFLLYLFLTFSLSSWYRLRGKEKIKRFFPLQIKIVVIIVYNTTSEQSRLNGVSGEFLVGRVVFPTGEKTLYTIITTNKSKANLKI